MVAYQKEQVLFEVPVSNDLRESILIVLNNERKNSGKGKRKGLLDIKSGIDQGEIVYVMVEQNISCQITEDKLYLYFSWPSGRKHRARKDEFLSELAQKAV